MGLRADRGFHTPGPPWDIFRQKMKLGGELGGAAVRWPALATGGGVVEGGDGAGGKPCGGAVGARVEDHRHLCPQHQTRAFGVADIGQLFGEHIARIDARHHEDIGAACDCAAKPLGAGGGHVDGIVHGQRPIDLSAPDLATFGHLGQESRIHGGLDGGGDGFHRREHAHARIDPQGERKVDGVLHDIDLCHQVGSNVDGGIGDHHRLGQARDIHQEHMGEFAPHPQAMVPVHHRTQEIIGVQMALHHRLGAHFMDQLAGHGGGGDIIACDINDIKPAEISPKIDRGGADGGGAAQKDRGDDALLCRKKRAAQGIGVIGADHRRDQRRQRAGTRDQRVEMAVALHDQAGDMQIVAVEFDRRGVNQRLAAEDQGGISGARHLCLQADHAVRGLGGDRHLTEEFVASAGGSVKGQALLAQDRARPRQMRAEDRRDQRGDEQASGDFFGFAIAVQIAIGQVHRVVIARGGGKDIEIIGGDQAAQLGPVAKAEFLKGAVDQTHRRLCS